MMFHWREGRLSRISINMRITGFTPGANPGFILGGGSYSFFSFFQNTSYIRKSTGHLREGGEGGAHPMHPLPTNKPARRRGAFNCDQSCAYARVRVYQSSRAVHVSGR